jgi:iron complex transport system ATP-binding protein
MSLLSLRNVSFSYPARRKVLEDISLDLERGSITAILGPNGAGKTTLLDICLGWKKPHAGQVLLQGTELGDLSRRERGKLLSLVPQRENVRFDFTALDYVLLGRTPHLGPLESPGREDVRIVGEALEETGISDLSGRSIATLSGGEYQLMLIARSLAQRPSLLLLDEPASQLDPARRILIIRMLKRLSAKGMAVLYTSHDPQAAAVAADTIHLLADGRFLVSGPPREALTEESLRLVYGVAFSVSWAGRSLHLDWDSEDGPIP